MLEGKGGRVLILEDEPAIARLQQLRLENGGFKVVVVNTVRDAKRLIDEGTVDLLILDNNLVGSITGLDFYFQLRQAGCQLPAILVTAYCDEAAVVKALRAGVRAYFPKSSTNLNYLAEAAERVLREVHIEREWLACKARLAGILAASTEALIVVEREGRITLFNPAAEQLFRCSALEAIGQPITRFIPQGLPAPEDGLSLMIRQPGERAMVGTAHHSLSGSRMDGDECSLQAHIAKVETPMGCVQVLSAREAAAAVPCEV
jgi:two-component system, cell cycle sensor histidine kinase and response regulator CckA